MPMSQVFAQIRNEYEKKGHPREELGPGHLKVLARDNECFITELPDKWRVDYDRRVGHHLTGYFAHNHIPYVTFAHLKHTDVYDLIGDNLDITMQKHWHYMQMLHLTQVGRPDQSSNGNDESPNTIVVVCDGTNKRRQPLPPSRNAGLSSIRVSLGSNARTMSDMAAGSSFKETTKLEDERQKYLTQMRARKEVKRGGRCVTVSNPSYYLRPMVHTASSKTCLVSNPKRSHKGKTEHMQESGSGQQSHSAPESDKNRSIGPNLYIALAAAQFKLHNTDRNTKRLKQDQELRLLKRKVQRECVAKLKSVYAILCCLHNMKMKDLKRREPMSFETVKTLSQKPLQSLTKDYHHDTHHHNGLLTLHHHPSAIHHALHSRHTLTNHSNNHLHGRHKNQRVKQFPLVETWEDLVHVGDKVKGQTQSVTINTLLTATCSSTTLPKIVSKETAWQEHGDSNVGGAAEQHHKSHRVLPPWQRQVVYVTNKEESLKRDPSKKLSDCIESFHYFKSEMSQKIKSSLNERKQQLEKHMALKLTHLELGANTDKCLDEMRERAYQVRREERAEEDNKPQWYVLLEKEVSSVFEQGGASEARLMLDKLKQFIIVDTDTLPYVLEKLCLLFMSLPANHLSIRSVFSAMQFVTEHIVKSPLIICQQWLDLRQLPPVTTELPDPAYLFGMHV